MYVTENPKITGVTNTDPNRMKQFVIEFVSWGSVWFLILSTFVYATSWITDKSFGSIVTITMIIGFAMQAISSGLQSHWKVWRLW